jgi:hypothetical protein
MSDQSDKSKPTPAMIDPAELQSIANAIGATVDPSRPNRLLWQELGVVFDLHDYDPPMRGDVLVTGRWGTGEDGVDEYVNREARAQPNPDDEDEPPKWSVYGNTPNTVACMVAASMLGALLAPRSRRAVLPVDEIADRLIGALLARAPQLRQHVAEMVEREPRGVRARLERQIREAAESMERLGALKVLGGLLAPEGAAPSAPTAEGNDYFKALNRLMFIRARRMLIGEEPLNLVQYMRPAPLQDPKHFDPEADEHHRAAYFAMHAHADMRWLLDEVMRTSPVADVDEQNRQAVAADERKKRAANLLSGGYESEGIDPTDTKLPRST